MQILMHTGGIAGTNCYVVADESAKQAVVFDAPDHTVAPLLDEVRSRRWDLVGLWLTHGHFDHVADHQVVRDAFPNAKVLIHRLDEPKLYDARPAYFTLPFTIPPGRADAHVEDGQVLTIGSLSFRVLFTPGHSPGHVCYHCDAERLLIGGDLMIGGSVGRTDLPDSDDRAMAASVRRVMELPDDTRLLGGHGDVSTIGAEREQNEAVRMMLQRAGRRGERQNAAPPR